MVCETHQLTSCGVEDIDIKDIVPVLQHSK